MNFFIFDQMFLVTDVSYGDWKGVIFLSFASLFTWCEQILSRKNFYSDDFYSKLFELKINQARLSLLFKNTSVFVKYYRSNLSNQDQTQ